jgi:uncharacterized protein (DUF2249 family)/iron-sulfur cluster repair protein YtfE (RIC family)
MNDVTLASNRADADAVAAVEQHHAEMGGALARHVATLVAAAARRDEPAATTARDELVRWCRDELLPHAAAEEDALYPAARRLEAGRLLVDGMTAEHRVITGLVEEITGAGDAVRAAAAARALQAVLDSHVAKENELILPLLAAAPDVSVAQLLAGMHDLLGGSPAEAGAGESGCGGHTCGCGELDGPGYPELDARTVPHAIRHATIFGALSGVGPGGGLVLVAPHDPVPLLGQVAERWPDTFAVSYLEQGPEAWRLAFTRLPA